MPFGYKVGQKHVEKIVTLTLKTSPDPLKKKSGLTSFLHSVPLGQHAVSLKSQVGHTHASKHTQTDYKLTLHPPTTPSPPAHTMLVWIAGPHQSYWVQVAWSATGIKACCSLSAMGPPATDTQAESITIIRIHQPSVKSVLQHFPGRQIHRPSQIFNSGGKSPPL